MRLKNCFVCLLLCVMICVSVQSCAPSVSFEPVKEAADKTAALEKYSANFYVELALSDGSVSLLYLNGTYSVDKSNRLVVRDSSQTYLGDAWHETEYYDGETLFNAEGDDKYQIKCDFASVIGQTIYATVPDIADVNVTGLASSSNESGTLYKFTAKNMAEFEKSTVGDNIYTLAALRKPQKELTKYSDLDCEYTVSDDLVTGWQLSYTISLYDTPPYAAGAQQNIEDYRLDVNVRIRVKIKSIGQEISAPAIDKDTYSVIESSQDTNQ